jgi:glutamate 5-kinase
MYESALREKGIRSAQILLTHADLADRERYLNARTTLLTLLGLNVIPVINENDTVVTTRSSSATTTPRAPSSPTFSTSMPS